MPQMFRVDARPQGLTQIGRNVTTSAIYTDFVSDSGKAFLRIESGNETSWWRLELVQAA